MKKLLSIALLVCILASMCTVSAWADTGTATVGGVTYTSLVEAVAAANSGDTITLTAGTFTATSLSGAAGKTIVIEGVGRDTTFLDMVQAQYKENSASGADITFRNLTINEDNNIYNGITHAAKISYDNCKINGQLFVWSSCPVSFSNCEFVQTDSNSYNIWTYSATNCTFTNCSFTCAGKSVLVYNEGHNGTNLTVSTCSFVATQTVAGKAAIEIDSSLLKASQLYTIDIGGGTQASGFDANSNCGNQLWNEKKSADQATIAVNGTPVYTQGGTTTPVDPNTGAPPTPADPAAPAAPAAPAVQNVYYIPATDDNSNMALWSILALALLTTAFVTRKRKAEN